MFKILTMKDEVRVPPAKFNLDLTEAVKASLQESIEGQLHPDIGAFLAVTDIINVGEGKIIPEDGAVYFPTEMLIGTFFSETRSISA